MTTIPTLVPTIEERDARLRRTREAMARDRLDALLVAGKGHWWTGRGYVRYLSDFPTALPWLYGIEANRLRKHFRRRAGELRMLERLLAQREPDD